MLKWTKYVPHHPTAKQLAALMLNNRELLFGGALGGGKSDFILMGALQYVDTPGYAAAIFRKQLTDLKQPGALLDRAKNWLSQFTSKRVPLAERVRWVPSEHSYYFPTWYADGSPGEDARLQFCYCNTSNAKERYQSAEFQYIGFDETSHWESPGDWDFMSTRLRNTVCPIHGKIEQHHVEAGKAEKEQIGDPIWADGCIYCEAKRILPLRLRGATNPGGAGGAWLKERFQIVPDPKLFPDRRDALLAIAEGTFVPFVGTHPEKAFIPSYVSDNPHLNQKDYDKFLNDLPEGERSRLRDGNWESRTDSRFNRRWVRYYDLYEDSYQIGTTLFSFAGFKRIFCTVDVASTVKDGPVDTQVRKGAPAATVVSTWGLTHSNDLFWLDMITFQDEVPRVVEEVTNAYLRFRPAYIKMEVNGVGIGPAQYARKIGIPVKNNVKSKDKIENSTAAMLLMKAGKIYFPMNKPWISTAEDQIFNWTGLPKEADDIVDTLSDAANEVGPLGDIVETSPDVKGKVTMSFKSTGRPPNLAAFNSARIHRNPSLSQASIHTRFGRIN